MKTTPFVALAFFASIFLGACNTSTPAIDTSTRIVEFNRGVFHWTNAEQEPRRTWTWRGKMEVTLTPNYITARQGDKQIIVPRERVIHMAEGIDPEVWQ